MTETKSPTVRAQWVGPFGDRFADGTVLVPNDTVCELPRGEAEESDNWKVLGGKPADDLPGAAEADAAAEAARQERARQKAQTAALAESGDS